MGKKKRDEKGYAVKKPFYKKVWFWGLVIFLTIGFSASLSGNKSEKTVKDTSEKVSEKKSSSKDSAESKSVSEEKVNIVGDTIGVGSLALRVNSVEVAKTVGPTVLPTNAKDTFLVVSLSVKNTGNKAITVDSSLFTLLDGEKEFQADATGSLSANQGEDGKIADSFFLQSLNPDVQMDGVVVFDVTEEQANSPSIQLEVKKSLFSSKKEIINLR